MAPIAPGGELPATEAGGPGVHREERQVRDGVPTVSQDAVRAGPLARSELGEAMRRGSEDAPPRPELEEPKPAEEAAAEEVGIEAEEPVNVRPLRAPWEPTKEERERVP